MIYFQQRAINPGQPRSAIGGMGQEEGDGAVPPTKTASCLL